MKTLVVGLLAGCVLAGTARAEVKTLRVPGAEVPDVALDNAGTLHVTYGKDQPGEAYYVRSADGKTFTAPVRLNRRAQTVTTGMERGPKIAVGKDGSIHVVWLGHYKLGGGAWYMRSTDGGKSFEPERNLVEPKYGMDNATIAADECGNVVVLWTGGLPPAQPDPQSPAASPIVLVRSKDNGVSFTKNEFLKSDHPVTGRACGCCRLEARLVNETLYVAFRGGLKSVRDPFFLMGPVHGESFTCVPISADQWVTTCPMMGIPFQIDAKGRVLVSWMSDHKAYFAVTEGQGKFTPKTAAPSSPAAQDFPLALANSKGEVFFMWTEGNRLVYAQYSATGQPLGQPRVAGQLPGRNKPTAFVDRAGDFVIVY